MKNERQYDLDWIKVIATLIVFLFHCAMFFNPFPWHVKNNELDYSFILYFSLITTSWIMPIFFIISGMSVKYALKRRGNSTFIVERFTRLGLPLLAGVFLLSPHQVYIERVTLGQYEGNFLSFLPNYFNGIYLEIGGSGNFAFMGLHLWYVLALMLFSFLCLPLFKKINVPRVPFYRLHFVVTIPLLLFGFSFIDIVNLGGWDLTFYLVLFLLGYYFAANDLFRKNVTALGNIFIIVALISSFVLLILFSKELASTPIYSFIRVISCWSWVVSIFYLASKYLNFHHKLLQYTSEASMPFYVLHQPVIVLVGYYLYQQPWVILVKAIILVITSFILIMNLYHFIFKRVNLLRVLVGLKTKKGYSL